MGAIAGAKLPREDWSSLRTEVPGNVAYVAYVAIDDSLYAGAAGLSRNVEMALANDPSLEVPTAGAIGTELDTIDDDRPCSIADHVRRDTTRSLKRLRETNDRET